MVDTAGAERSIKDFDFRGLSKEGTRIGSSKWVEKMAMRVPRSWEACRSTGILGELLRLPLEHEQTKMVLYTLGGLFVYLIAGPFELLFFFSFFSLLTKKKFLPCQSFF